MNNDRTVGFRPSPNHPVAYVVLTQHDTIVVERFIETNERPPVLLPGPRPDFKLCEYIRAAPDRLSYPERIRYAILWLERHGRPLQAWRTWTADLPPGESDYDEPAREPTITSP